MKLRGSGCNDCDKSQWGRCKECELEKSRTHAGLKFNTLYSKLYRTNLSHLSDQELTYVYKNKLLYPKDATEKAVLKRYVRGKIDFLRLVLKHEFRKREAYGLVMR